MEKAHSDAPKTLRHGYRHHTSRPLLPSTYVTMPPPFLDTKCLPTRANEADDLQQRKTLEEADAPVNAQANKEKTDHVAEQSISELIQRLKPTNTPSTIGPRPLKNSNSTCFLNVILQTLVSCPYVFGMLLALSDCVVDFGELPTVSLVVRYFREHRIIAGDASTEKQIDIGKPHNPDYFRHLLAEMGTDGETQQDAHEFLMLLLDKLHSELGSVKSTVSNEPSHSSCYSDDNETSQWEFVGPRHRAIPLSVYANKKTSPVSDLFEGLVLVSTERTKGARSAIEDPFWSLYLQVDNSTNSLEDALKAYFQTEQVFGHSANKHCFRRTQLLKLPPVLILLLKKFTFSASKGMIKQHCKLSYPAFFNTKLFPSIHPEFEHGFFHLHSVIRHLGQSLDNGHYTCDVRHAGNQWLHFDDETVLRTHLSNVLSHSHAYILVYTYDSQPGSKQSNRAQRRRK